MPLRLAGLMLGVALCCALLFPTTTWAYKANVGDRAANFKGFDIVNREVVELDDYLGQCVFIDFWATWCGPCMRELPRMLAATRPYVDSGKLKVITVNGDPPELRSELRQAIRQHHITYPVIHDGGIYDPQKFHRPIAAVEWGVHAWPSTFLINPQGVIVANYLWGKDKDLGRILEFYLSNEPPVMGVSGFVELHEDGKSVSIIANVMNQGMGDVKLRLSGYMDRLQWDENNVVYGSEEIAGSPISMNAIVSFDEFCEASHEFVIEPEEDWHTFSCSLWLEVPGGEDLLGREDRGYEILSSLDEFRLLDLENVDGEWVVQQD